MNHLYLICLKHHLIPLPSCYAVTTSNIGLYPNGSPCRILVASVGTHAPSYVRAVKFIKFLVEWKNATLDCWSKFDSVNAESPVLCPRKYPKIRPWSCTSVKLSNLLGEQRKARCSTEHSMKTKSLIFQIRLFSIPSELRF